MRTYAPIWSMLVDSSVWEEEDHVLRVFIGLLALKDMEHVVSLDTYQITRRLHMDYEKVEDALKVLSSPDKRRPNQEHQGRRIVKVADGWFVVNGQKYKEEMQKEQKRARDRKAQAAWRARQSSNGKAPVVDNREDLIRQERANAKAMTNKADELQAEADAEANAERQREKVQ